MNNLVYPEESYKIIGACFENGSGSCSDLRVIRVFSGLK